MILTPATKKSFDDLDPEEFLLVEGEERRFLDPRSQKVHLQLISNNLTENIIALHVHCMIT